MANSTGYKGILECPICHAKTFVKNGAHGEVSSPCRCKHILIFNYDNMSVEISKPIRGLSQKLLATANK